MKLLRVVAKNFKIPESNIEFNFVPIAPKNENDKEFELHEIADELYVYNTICIIGKNASGKTSSVELLSIVYNILSEFRITSVGSAFKFSDEPINLDITFYHKGTIYRYLTDISKNKTSIGTNSFVFQNQKIFKREYKKTHIRYLFDYDKYELLDLNMSLPADTSLLYAVLKDIDLYGITCMSDDDAYRDYERAFDMYKLFSEGNMNIMTPLLKMFDEHLKSIEKIGENKFIIRFSDGNNKEVSSLDLFNILSSGTSKGLLLYIYVVYSLRNGTDIIIDEIENHFHKALVENLIALYKDKSVNKHAATLIFTTHYCELLELLNRSDNIYISKYKQSLKLENMYLNYKVRPDTSKSNKFYRNEFDTSVSYDALMDFKKELMQ